MGTRILCLVSILVISGCSSGVTQEELDQAVADAVAAAKATTTSPATTAPVPAPTTSTQRNISQSATEGEVTYDIGILRDGSCTQIVREIEDVAGAAQSAQISTRVDANSLFVALLLLDADALPTLDAWTSSYLEPAGNIVRRVADDDHLPLYLTAYASNVGDALGGWLGASWLLPSYYTEQGVGQWLDYERALTDAVENYPPCND